MACTRGRRCSRTTRCAGPPPSSLKARRPCCELKERRLGGATALCPGLNLRLTLRAHGCAAHSGRAAAPLRARREATPGLRCAEPCSKSPIPPLLTTQVVRRMLGGSDVSRVGPVGGYVDPGAGTAVLTMTLAAPSGVYAARGSNSGLTEPTPGSKPGPAGRSATHTCAPRLGQHAQAQLPHDCLVRAAAAAEAASQPDEAMRRALGAIAAIPPPQP